MIKRKKINAFTLGELLIVMVISSLVVSLSFLALNNIQRQMRSVQATFKKQQKILTLERMLTTDLHGGTAYCDIQSTTSGQTHEVFKGNYFNHFEAGPRESSSWLSSSDQKTITINNHKDTIRYRITAHKIYREQDSINIAIHQVTCYLEGKKVDKGNFDAIALSFTDTYNQQGFFIYKRNDIAHYINQ